MKKFTYAVMAGVSLLAVSTPVFAADEAATAADEATSEEASDDGIIIVEARRKAENLQDVPSSVQAVTGDTLQKLEVKSFVDVASIAPGLSLSRATNGIQNTVSMRGISFNPTAAGPQNAVELYRNDVVTSSAAVFQAVYDLQQIEVLRGPQGTLRGRASPSGSITLTTKKPNLTEMGGFASGSYAEGSEWNVSGAVNVPVINDRLGIRVSGYASKDRGANVQGLNLITKAVDKDTFDKVSSYRASVRAVPVEDVLTLDFNYEDTTRKTRSFEQVQSRKYADGSGLAGPVDIKSTDRLGIQGLATTLNGRFKFYNWQAKLDLGEHIFTYVGGRLDAKSIAFGSDDVGGFLANQVAPAIGTVNAPPAGTTHRFGQDTDSQQHQKFHEFRLQNDERVGGIFDYVVGYMSLHSNTPTVLYQSNTSCVGGGANCVIGGLSANTLSGVDRLRSDKENSLFGNITVHIGESTEISGGARSITFERNAGLRSSGRNGVGQLLFDAEPISSIRTYARAAAFDLIDKKQKAIYQIGAKHKISSDLMVYANYGTSFRPGNIIVCSRCNAAQGAALNAGGFLVMKDENSTSVEAGFKSTFMDRRGTLNVSVFSQKFDNYTAISPFAIDYLGSFTAGSAGPPVVAPTGTLSGATNSFALVNPVKVQGMEAEFGFRPSDNFSFGGNLAYAKSTATNGRVPCLDLNNDNFQDATPLTAATVNTLAAQAGAGLVDTCSFTNASPAPRFSATLNGEYSAPLFGANEGYLRGLVSFNGSTVGDDNNPFDQVSSYAIANLYAGIREEDGKWDLSAYVKNLTNTNRVLTQNGTRATSTIARTAYVSDYYQISSTAPREFGLTLRVAFGSR